MSQEEEDMKIKVDVVGHGTVLRIHHLGGYWSKDRQIFLLSHDEAWDLHIELKGALEEADEAREEFKTKHQD